MDALVGCASRPTRPTRQVVGRGPPDWAGVILVVRQPCPMGQVVIGTTPARAPLTADIDPEFSRPVRR